MKPVKTWMVAVVVLLAVVRAAAAHAQGAQATCPGAPHYGSGATNGHVARVNGISLYYEIHGHGAPLLLIHGNGDSINSVRCQIAFFSRSRRVIVADSRSHGRSSDAEGRLTYEQIADDLARLLTELKVETTDVWGHSDGGIVALLLAIRHPAKVGKLVSSSPNLRPDTTALFPWFIERVRQRSQNATQMIKTGDRSRDWSRVKRHQDLMLEEPHITEHDLHKILAPTLLMFADADIIPLEHAIEVFNGLPRAQLFIMPGATHRMPAIQSDAYNALVHAFLSRPFLRPTGQLQSPP